MVIKILEHIRRRIVFMALKCYHEPSEVDGPGLRTDPGGCACDPPELVLDF